MRWPDAADVREHITDANDGILAVAGFSEGLVGAGLASTEVFGIIGISAIAGAVSVAGAKLGEVAAHRDAEQRLVEQERRLLELTPDEEIAELAEYYEAKGVSAVTARAVAEELSTADALSAQLEVEYGIRELTQPGQASREAVWSGVAFLLGAGIPVAMAFLFPGDWLDEFTLLAVVIALATSGLVLAKLGGTRVWRSLLRSVLIGLASLGASYLVGSWLF